MFTALQNIGRNTTTVDELCKLPHNDPSTLFVDVREKDEWDEGHIGWFRHIPLVDIPKHISEFKQYSKIYFICRSGGRSGRACDALKGKGHTGAWNVVGGMNAWESQGLPVVKD